MSLFHEELFSFLKNDAEKRIAEEGYDPAMDPKLVSLQKALSPLAADEADLSEVIDSYQSVFSERGPIHLDQKVYGTFSEKEFFDLGLEKYFPRIYRGLPRVYKRDNPANSRIKADFTHLPTIKRLAAEKAIFSLYQHYQMPKRGKIAFFTHVLSDGLGDLSAAMEAAELICQRWPHFEIHLVFLSKDVSAQSLDVPKGCLLHLFESLSHETLQLLRSCDLIVQMPTYYQDWPKVVQSLRTISGGAMPEIECIGEYGFIESSWFHPKTGNRSMGLHFLEKGILIRDIDPVPVLENPIIRQWLDPKADFYFAYLSTMGGGMVYLHSLLKKLEKEDRPIDLCLPDLLWLFQYIESRIQDGKPILEKNYGVGSIEITFDGKIYAHKVADIGKKLRILSPGKISKSDFRALIQMSGEWVGVRGNQSLSEVISANKAFFYDDRMHIRYFMKDLVSIAENRLFAFPQTREVFRLISQAFEWNLPKEENSWVDEVHFRNGDGLGRMEIAERMGKLLQNPKAIQGYKKLGRILAHEFSCNEFICHLVQRAFCHRRRPDIKDIEERGWKRFGSGEISFSEMVWNLKEIL